MAERDAFGPNLRRERIKRGISLQSIARTTKINQDLLEGLEQNDFSRWPSGIFARAYIRSYALEIGADADSTVNDFCKWFPQGDRRVDRLVRGQAAIIGHSLQWSDDLAAGGVAIDRRVPDARAQVAPLAVPGRKRLVASILDSVIVIAAGLLVSMVTPISAAASIAVCSLLYYGSTLATIGSTPVAWALDTYLEGRHPSVEHRRHRKNGSKRRPQPTQVLSRSEH
jgi:transcriptional regulator with XRE-family HTH domain